jgi:hypothetical protein
LAKIPWIFKDINEGFRMGKLLVDLPHNQEWESSPSLGKTFLPSEVLETSEFTYLGRGSQSFVFASQEGRYILKLFRSPPKIHPWREVLRTLLLHRKLAPQQEKIDVLLSGAKLAFEKAKDLTGLVYVHLNSTQGTVPVVALKDKLGRVHHVDLGRCRFAIQYRAEPFREVFLDALKQKDQKKIRELVSSFAKLIEERASRGIQNEDPKVSTNFGYLNGQVIEWDFGSYRLTPHLLLEEETDRFLSSLCHFALRHSDDETLFPEGVP